MSRAGRDPATAGHLGIWLAVTFGVCLITGLISHGIQHPPGWFDWPSRPVNLYRITQGTHVLSGIAAIPLLAAKLWSVAPKLFERPVVRSPAHLLERVSLLVLVSSATFELLTGLFNIAQNYPWNFAFPDLHFALGWIAVGSLLLHAAVKIPVFRSALGEPHEPAERGGLVSRRGFLGLTALSVGTAVTVTAGMTVPWLRDLAVLSTRSPNGPQGLPVNRTATAAGILDISRDPGWRLEVSGPRGTRAFSRPELAALPQTTAELPIACVEGWSQQATWSGVPLADLLRAVGAPADAEVRVSSLEEGSPYSSTVLPAAHARDPLTLLALGLGGEPLHPDHGYPCRLIAPNRPGVLQTKWVRRVEVL